MGFKVPQHWGILGAKISIHDRAKYTWYRNNSKVLAIETKAFREGQKTEIPGIGKRLVVDHFSSDPQVGRTTPINGADHFSIVKPQSENDTVYIGVKEFISEHLPQRSSGSKSVEKEQQEESFF